MTAREMTAKIRRLHCAQCSDYARLERGFDLWEHELDGGAVLRVRREPDLGGVFYRVWTAKRNRILSMLFAMTPETAGKKARSLVTPFGEKAP